MEKRVVGKIRYFDNPYRDLKKTLVEKLPDAPIKGGGGGTLVF